MEISYLYSKSVFPFYFISLFLFSISCKPEKVDLCHAYKDYFEGEGSVFKAKDSIDVLKYNQRLKELYSDIKEVNFTGTLPYESIYAMKNYDTSLLFKVLELFSKDTLEYKMEIGIPRYFATRIIRSDAVIKGRVVNKIDHYEECRYFVTTYFITVDSVIHSYFPINIGDTVLIHFNAFGVTGYCDFDEPKGYSEIVNVKDYNIGETDLYFYLNRESYVKLFYKVIKAPESNYLDPYCYNSFFRDLRNENIEKNMIKCDKEKLSTFIKKIKTKRD